MNTVTPWLAILTHAGMRFRTLQHVLVRRQGPWGARTPHYPSVQDHSRFPRKIFTSKDDVICRVGTESSNHWLQLGNIVIASESKDCGSSTSSELVEMIMSKMVPSSPIPWMQYYDVGVLCVDRFVSEIYNASVLRFAFFFI